jgi:hypothetical protein
LKFAVECQCKEKSDATYICVTVIVVTVWWLLALQPNVIYMGMAMIAPTHIEPRFCDIAHNFNKNTSIKLMSRCGGKSVMHNTVFYIVRTEHCGKRGSTQASHARGSRFRTLSGGWLS